MQTGGQTPQKANVMGWAGRGAITRPPLHLQNEIDPKMVATEQPR